MVEGQREDGLFPHPEPLVMFRDVEQRPEAELVLQAVTARLLRAGITPTRR